MSETDAAKYWDNHADEDTNSIVCWEFPGVVTKYENLRVTGDQNLGPVPWFLQKYGPFYGPFNEALSIGCGTGILEKFLIATPHFTGRVLGLDISERSIEQARQDCKGNDRARFEVADLNHDTLPEGQFDVVFAHGALHHIQNLDWVLGQAAKSLKPKGLLYVNDYVGPQRFQWSDVQVRLANELLSYVPRRWINKQEVVRCDATELAAKDPSEACNSHFIEDTIRAHFDIVERRPRGGSLLAPIFGGSCIRESILESPEGEACIRKMCKAESILLDCGILPANHVVIIATSRAQISLVEWPSE